MADPPKPLEPIPYPDWLGKPLGEGQAARPEASPPPPPPSPAPAPHLPTQEEVFGLPVTPEAIQHAQWAADVLNGHDDFKPGGVAAGSASTITVLTHPDGTITLGVSGSQAGAERAVAVLAAHPDLPPGTRIGPAHPTLEPGQSPCAEVRAAQGAQIPDASGNPPPPPTGMATIPRDPEGKAAQKYSDPSHPPTLCPCGSCQTHSGTMREQLGQPPATPPASPPGE